MRSACRLSLPSGQNLTDCAVTRLLALVLAAVVLGAGAAGPSSAAGPAGDPSTWIDRQLALRLIMAGYDMSRTAVALPLVREGLGGVLLFGRPPADLGRRLAELRATGGPAPLVASDEEGRQVQRLAGPLPRLPSAASLALTRSLAESRVLAADYGRQMRALGVDVSFAPSSTSPCPGSTSPTPAVPTRAIRRRSLRTRAPGRPGSVTPRWYRSPSTGRATARQPTRATRRPRRRRWPPSSSATCGRSRLCSRRGSRP